MANTLGITTPEQTFWKTNRLRFYTPHTHTHYLLYSTLFYVFSSVSHHLHSLSSSLLRFVKLYGVELLTRACSRYFVGAFFCEYSLGCLIWWWWWWWCTVIVVMLRPENLFQVLWVDDLEWKHIQHDIVGFVEVLKTEVKNMIRLLFLQKEVISIKFTHMRQILWSSPHRFPMVDSFYVVMINWSMIK